MENLIKILNSSTIVTGVVGIIVIAFARSIIKIFRMGVTWRTELATQKELREFEADVRKDMRAYCVQIQELVLKSAMNVINNKLKDIDDAKNALTEIKVLKAEFDTQMKAMDEKYEEIRTVGNTVRTLTNKVSRIEYNVDSKNSERRSEN